MVGDVGEQGSEGPERLRVALVCPYSLSRPGGVQGQVVGLARALERRGHRTTVFAPLDAPALDAPAPDAPALAHPIDVLGGASVEFDLVVTGRSVGVRANGSVAPVSLSVSGVTRSLRRVRAGDFDVVHVHEPFAPGLPYGLLAARGLPPVVATFHRSGGSPLYRVFRPLTSRLAGRLALRCAVSEAALSTAREALGGSFELCFNGVEVEAFSEVEPWPAASPPGRTILFLGRHEERKGLGVLLGAFDRLRRPADRAVAEGPGPVLWIAGDGPDTGALRHRYPPSADLEWLGVLSEEEKVRRLVGATVLCAPSLRGESFGMVLLEAMAARTLVVASDIPGYRDAAGGHAVLVPPGDEAALAEALAPLVAGSDGEGPSPRVAAESDRLDAAWAWAAHWSMDRLAEWYERHYRSVAAGNGRASGG